MSFLTDLFEGNFGNLGRDLTHAPSSLAKHPKEMWETGGAALAGLTGGAALGLFPGLAGAGAGLGGLFGGAGGFDLAAMFGGGAAAGEAALPELAGLTAGGADPAIAALFGGGEGSASLLGGGGADALYGTFGPGAENSMSAFGASGGDPFSIAGSGMVDPGQMAAYGGGMADPGGGLISSSPWGMAEGPGADVLPGGSTLDIGGGAPGAPGSFGGPGMLGKAWDWIGNNPMMAATLGLGAAGIGKQLIGGGNQGDAQLKNLAEQAGGNAAGLTHKANQFLAPSLTGKLPPQLEAQVQQALHDAMATEKSKYASLGLSNSTMSADQEAYLQLQTEAMRGKLAQELAQTGTALMGQATANLSLESQLYSELMNMQMQQDETLSKSIMGFAGALAYSSVAGQRRVA